jgi:hypothetical protein
MAGLMATNAPAYYKFAGKKAAMAAVKAWMAVDANGAKLADLVAAVPGVLST